MSEFTPALTEARNPLSSQLDQLAPLDFARLMNRMDSHVPLAIAEALPQIAQGIEAIAGQLERGGRLFYQGAGTSGRLGTLDASELVPTFGFPPERAIALVAGGSAAITQAVEGAEDDFAQGRADLLAHNFGPGDVLVSLAASGSTPYALGGLAYAQEVGAPSIALVCNPGSPMAAAAQIPIEVVTGPEILTGSTRLKAGTAQKMVLNMLSTGAMVQIGKVYGNWMVDVQISNQKLHARGARIVAEITGVAQESAERLLTQADNQVKVAVVMGLTGVDAEQARQRLAENNGRVR
jgi:N-acetylmuramic acid 6-phosphate etherase